MISRWISVAIGVACMISIPVIFEASTFHLYTVSDPTFFTFSGARLWIDLTVLVSSGFLIGTAALRPVLNLAIVIIGVIALILSFYHFCESRQCYYPGPDGFGELRLGVLFFAVASTGVMLGLLSRRNTNRHNSLVFGTTTAILLGYYPCAVLFGTYRPEESNLALLSIVSSVPYLFAGIMTRIFSAKITGALSAAFAAWAVLAALFIPLRPDSAPVWAVMLLCSLPMAVVGFKLAPRLAAVKWQSITGTLLLTFFSISAVQPFVDAPMDLSPGGGNSLLAESTYYSGAFHQEDRYFPTKRVEVAVYIDQLDAVGAGDFLVAGMGAQSPNCCKDGLDYGYRADLLINGSGAFVVARSWETCDHNVACSAMPWISMMHKSISSLISDTRTVMLAMEWQPDKTVTWSYRVNGSDWREFSHFQAPSIENPYFNLGVIDTGIPITNPDKGDAYFYQVGISVPKDNSASGRVTFDCPAYYDLDGHRHCANLEPVSRGNSHWKVLWKWGEQGGGKVNVTGGSTVSIELE